MRSSTETLIAALHILASDIQSEDGVANAAIAEAAERLAELERENAALRAELKRTTKRIEILSTCFYAIEDTFKNTLTAIFEDSLKVDEKEAQP